MDEVEHLREENARLQEQLAEQDARGLRLAEEVEKLRDALNRAGDRLAQVQPGVTEPWAFDIVPKAEREIADALAEEVIAEDISPR